MLSNIIISDRAPTVIHVSSPIRLTNYPMGQDGLDEVMSWFGVGVENCPYAAIDRFAADPLDWKNRQSLQYPG